LLRSTHKPNQKETQYRQLPWQQLHAASSTYSNAFC
jgi:hypothetical protein